MSRLHLEQHGIGPAFRAAAQPRERALVDALGVPYRVHYLLLAAFAASIGAVGTVFALFPIGAELRHPVVLATCIAGLGIAPVYLWLARRWRYAYHEWPFQAIIAFAFAGPFVTQQFLPDVRSAFLGIYMVGAIGAAYYLTFRHALPHIAVNVAAAVYMSTTLNEPDAILRGSYVALLAVFAALTVAVMRRALERIVSETEAASERDALTGAYNMRRFESRVEDEIAHQRRGGAGFALIEFDLDHFKYVNDITNHSVGDAMLTAVARALAKSLTPADLLVRRGGDEFIAVVPLRNGLDLGQLTDDACRRAAEARLELCPDLPATVSAGYVISSGRELPGELLAAADAAMHESKEKTRAETGLGRYAGEIGLERDVTRHEGRRAARTAELDQDPQAVVVAIAWTASRVFMLAVFAIVLVLKLSGLIEFDLSVPELGILATAGGMVAVASWWGLGGSRHSRLAPHAFSLTGLALIAAGIAVVDRSGAAVAELLIVVALLAPLMLPPRWTTVYGTLAAVLYLGFLIALDYSLWPLRFTLMATITGLFVVLLTVTRTRMLEAVERRARMARTDPLTGMANARELHRRLAEEIDRAETTDRPLALVVFDLNRFKEVNDRHGLAMGDAVLREVAAVAHRAVRAGELAARRGGDEFAVVLPEADAAQAAATAARLATEIRDARLRLVADVDPEIGTGWATARPGDGIGDLIDRADSHLHDRRRASADPPRRVGSGC